LTDYQSEIHKPKRKKEKTLLIFRVVYTALVPRRNSYSKVTQIFYLSIFHKNWLKKTIGKIITN